MLNTLKEKEMLKKSYFQGTENPTPKKKKYKSDPAVPARARFTEPLYKNYDLYDVPGKHGPGSGYHSLLKYKSVSDFLKAKRKKLKDKYKSKDSYKKARMEIFDTILKKGIDFYVDTQIKSLPFLGDSGTYSDSTGIGGNLDEYLPRNDFEGKSPDKLNFGRDYVEYVSVLDLPDDILELLMRKYLLMQEPSLYGMPDGIKPKEDLDADKTINHINPEYGRTDLGNMTYKNMWI